MEATPNLELNFKLDSLTGLWFEFCQKHTELYELTCDEYMQLLASDIETLDETISQKSLLLGYIDALDNRRQALIKDIGSHYQFDDINKISDLISILKENNQDKPAKELERTNLLLLDIIENIQEQNKKNQIFLNKAITSLQDLRASFNGKKSYKTYSSNGMKSSSSTI